MSHTLPSSCTLNLGLLLPPVPPPCPPPTPRRPPCTAGSRRWPPWAPPPLRRSSRDLWPARQPSRPPRLGARCRSCDRRLSATPNFAAAGTSRHRRLSNALGWLSLLPAPFLTLVLFSIFSCPQFITSNKCDPSVRQEDSAWVLGRRAAAPDHPHTPPAPPPCASASAASRKRSASSAAMQPFCFVLVCLFVCLFVGWCGRCLDERTKIAKHAQTQQQQNKNNIPSLPHPCRPP